MHIAFRGAASSQSDQMHFLFTDLPGEWFDSLVDRADVATRLQFLQRADGVVLMLDGPRFAASGTRHLEVQRTERLLERLLHAVKVGLHIPFVVAISKRDLIEGIPTAIEQVIAKARSLGFSPVVVELTSFSTRPAVFPNGAGVREILRTILSPPAQPALSLDGGKGTRWYQKYGAIGRP
jgi:signal recognition particle receptor subunit beta